MNLRSSPLHALEILFAGIVIAMCACVVIGTIIIIVRRLLHDPFLTWDLALPPQTTIRIRFASLRDEKALEAIDTACFPDTMLGERELRENEYDIALVALIEKQIVGYARICSDEEEISIASLAVLPGHRIRVIQPLLKSVHHLLTQNHITEVEAYCREKTSYRLVQKHGQRIGFVIIDDSEGTPCGDEQFHCVRLRVQAPQTTIQHEERALSPF
jgi:N-acetylglutamate synthase-like GNAT family acetyltransferase